MKNQSRYYGSHTVFYTDIYDNFIALCEFDLDPSMMHMLAIFMEHSYSNATVNNVKCFKGNSSCTDLIYRKYFFRNTSWLKTSISYRCVENPVKYLKWSFCENS